MQQKPPSLSPSSFMFIFPINSKKKIKKNIYLFLFQLCKHTRWSIRDGITVIWQRPSAEAAVGLLRAASFVLQLEARLKLKYWLCQEVPSASRNWAALAVQWCTLMLLFFLLSCQAFVFIVISTLKNHIGRPICFSISPSVTLSVSVYHPVSNIWIRWMGTGQGAWNIAVIKDVFRWSRRSVVISHRHGCWAGMVRTRRWEPSSVTKHPGSQHLCNCSERLP